MEKVYPKVKIRDSQEQDDYSSGPAYARIHSSSPSPQVVADKDEYKPPLVRIPRVSISSRDSTPGIKGAEKNSNKNNAEESKSNIKPSTVLRPRAVLSSPVNDIMVGSKNKPKPELVSGLKNHNACQNRHVQCKVSVKPIVSRSPMTSRTEFKETAQVKNELPGTKQLATTTRKKTVGHS